MANLPLSRQEWLDYHAFKLIKSRAMQRNVIGIATIVTEAFVDEFAILKYSFELYHGTGCRWFVRCDRASLPALSA